MPPRAGRRRSSPPSSPAPELCGDRHALGGHPRRGGPPFYGEWIRSYAGEDYQKTNDALVELMDTLAESCTEAEYQRLEEIFVNCSRYELGFWEMAWTLER
ncbi:MAG: hypothetical protein ACLTYN_09625 [Dysosmobacter welbionis]